MKTTCNGCYYEHDRNCYWFKFVKKQRPKIIPTETFDKGCPQYKNNNKHIKSKDINLIISKFDGEIIGSKYEPRPFYYSKKKSYTTSNKYTHRKDAQ